MPANIHDHNEIWKEAYAAGFKAGFEAGKQASFPTTTNPYNPNTNVPYYGPQDCNCPIQGHICMSTACPRRINWTTVIPGVSTT